MAAYFVTDSGLLEASRGSLGNPLEAVRRFSVKARE